MVAGCNMATGWTYYEEASTDNGSWDSWTVHATSISDPWYFNIDVNDGWDPPNNER